MHTVELIRHSLDLAWRLGYTVRQEWLGSKGGGCVLRGRKFLFVDLTLDPADQLQQLIDILRREPGAAGMPMPQRLRELLTLQETA